MPETFIIDSEEEVSNDLFEEINLDDDEFLTLLNSDVEF